MIPADQWLDNGDGTAWVATRATAEGAPYPIPFDLFDRPCDLCDPHAWIGGKPDLPCGDCDGTGRHTFPIEVEHDGPTGAHIASSDGSFRRVYRVSVKPGMVLPIVEHEQWRLDPMFPVVTKVMLRYMLRRANGTCDWITLPSAAKPGMWCVKLQVHS
jgi:hypothetical protein